MATKKAAGNENNQEVVRKERVRTKALVLPPYSLKDMAEGTKFAIRIDSEITDKPDMEKDGVTQKLDKQKKPAFLHLVQVTDLDTGQIGEMVLPFIMHKALATGEPLKGRCFEMVKGKEETNKATMWEVYEIEE